MDIKAQIFVVLIFLLPLYSSGNKTDPIVELPNGKIRGLDHGHYLSFESIPYAEPPIGVNRFEAPKPYSGNWSDIRDATQPPVVCMQWDQMLFKEDLLNGVEDCLTINVYTPSLSGNKTYPVLIIIHGGAFLYGSARENGQDFLMENGKLVVVKMNYRLGPLGFLSTADDVISGNFGLKDQLLAMEWTKANVGAFNGNPDKITVLGFSAGASSVHLHMMNKNFEKFAKSGISVSGTALNYWSVNRQPVKDAFTLAKHLNCPTKSSSLIKKCLQNKDAAEIVRGLKEFQRNNIGYNPSILFGPVVESKNVTNAFLTDEPEFLIRSGKTAQIPWLTSFTTEDGGFNAAELMQKNSNGVELIEILNERWLELAPKNLFFTNVVGDNELEAFTNSMRQKYMGNKTFNAENYFLLQKLYTDVIFADAAKKAWTLHKEYSHSPVYGYVYDNQPPFGFGQVLSNRTDMDFGTVHGDDYALFVNDLVLRKELFTHNQKVMSKKFVKMVEDICLTGELQFGTCKFIENSSRTKGIFVMNITSDSCRSVSIDKLQ